MKIRNIVLASIVVLVTVGCSSGDDELVAPTTPTSEAEPTPEATSTAAPTPTATVPATSTPAPTSTTAPTPTVAPTTTAGSIEELLAGRIRELFTVREAANDAPGADPTDPALATVATGDALADLVAETTRRQQDGLAIRAGDGALAEIRVGFVDAQDATASVSVCSIDDGVIYQLDTGEVLNDAVATHNYQIDLVLVDGVWLTSRVVRLQQWEGVAGCALAPGDFPY